MASERMEMFEMGGGGEGKRREKKRKVKFNPSHSETKVDISWSALLGEEIGGEKHPKKKTTEKERGFAVRRGVGFLSFSFLFVLFLLLAALVLGDILGAFEGLFCPPPSAPLAEAEPQHRRPAL